MTETVLLVGGGGREHAIARAVAGDATLYACAGNRNPGIAALADGFETLDTTTPQAVVAYAEEVGATLAVVGPETPLEAGVADALVDSGVYAFGPTADTARIETDKAYQRRFMREHGIPGCPAFETFDDTERACEFVDEHGEGWVVKPAGLTGGKGVRVVGDQVTPEEAVEYLREADYDRVVVEERLVGEEFTLQALVADGDVRVTPAVQDHKRAYEGDEGPNTGGMGSYSDSEATLPFMDQEDYDAAVGIVEETVAALDEYTGVLYGQFMLTADGPKVVEFNARFGDPEAMNVLPVLDTDFVSVLAAGRDGKSLPALDFADRATVCKYAVPEGYPDDPTAGAKVNVDESAIDEVNERFADEGSSTAVEGGRSPEAMLCYASVDERDDGVYTTTSRAFAVVGIADDIATAEEVVEETLAYAGTEGLRVRHDIGTADLVESRIEHMDELRDASGH
ncbi:phosphoribosylamine--glycine ligase [Halococcus hamelinensis]|uniref:Phosphoribosylamine--glycine ligase n=1 Tax=Halococcus hamelinensis 100A6 TaxID=1132509 RepID=M0LT26_9EURY|nr:phosphoribosylamine--glycine ligase [Halococcus hamelinensis]EMA36717.1 phosphoribosylamine--glycine ligase [Halococcus hamelinensis 100A6]